MRSPGPTTELVFHIFLQLSHTRQINAFYKELRNISISEHILDM